MHILKGQSTTSDSFQKGDTVSNRNTEPKPQIEMQYQFLARVSELLNTSLDYKETLDRLSHFLVPHFGDYCVIDLVESQDRLVRIGMAHKDPEKNVLVKALHKFSPKKHHPHPLNTTLFTGKTQIIPSLDAVLLKTLVVNKRHHIYLTKLNPTSYICIPLIARQKTIGAITLVATHNSREYTIEDALLLEELSRQAALAIDNARLFAEAQEEILQHKKTQELLTVRQKQQAAVTSFGLHALSGANFESLLKELVEQIAQTLNIEFCKVLEYFPEKKHFHLRTGIGWKPGLVDPVTVDAGKKSQSGYTLLANRPVIVNDIRTETRFSPAALLKNHHVVSGISVTIPGKQYPFGVLGAHTAKKRFFTKDDAHFMQSMANILATVIERKRVEYMQQFLVQVSNLLSSSLDYEKTLAKVVRIIVPNLADWCAIHIVEPNASLRRLVVAHTDPQKMQYIEALDMYPHTKKVSVGVFHVLHTGKSELYPFVDKRTMKKIAGNEKNLTLFKEVGITSALIVPLKVRKKILGTMMFVRSMQERYYTKDELAVAEEVARRAAIAVENALLYEAETVARTKAESAEKELLKSKHQLEIIFNNVADGITVQDAKGHLVFANDAAAFSLGLPNAKTLLEANLPTLLKHYKLTDEQGTPFSFERLPGRRAMQGELDPEEVLHFKNKLTNQEHWSMIKARPVFDERGNVLFAINIFHDITHRKQAEKRKDEFIGIASHELKTPVTSIKAFTQVLHQRFSQEGNKEAAQMFEKMDTQLKKLTKLITDLLDISRIQAGKLEFHQGWFSLDDLVDEVIEDYQRITSTHKLMKQGRISKQIYGDHDRFYQVLINLVSNAVKYSPKASKVIITVKLQKEKAYVSVQDYGIGIPSENQKKIFDRFFRGVDSKKETFPGLGVGLYISSEITRRHGGSILVESKLNQGSTFTVVLPVKEK